MWHILYWENHEWNTSMLCGMAPPPRLYDAGAGDTRRQSPYRIYYVSGVRPWLTPWLTAQRERNKAAAPSSTSLSSSKKVEAIFKETEPADTCAELSTGHSATTMHSRPGSARITRKFKPHAGAAPDSPRAPVGDRRSSFVAEELGQIDEVLGQSSPGQKENPGNQLE